MDRPDVLQLILTGHGIDAGLAAALRCPSGAVVVEMLPPPHEYHGLALPDALAHTDIGVVLACGPDVTLVPGQMVATAVYDGQWIEGFATPAYRTKNQVRCYGHYCPHRGVALKCDWWDSLPVIILPETEEMVATHTNLIVRRQAPVRQIGGVALPDSETYRTGLATVESIGPACDLETPQGPVRPGDLVHYDVRGELEFAFEADPALAIVSAPAVNFVISQDDKAA